MSGKISTGDESKSPRVVVQDITSSTRSNSPIDPFGTAGSKMSNRRTMYYFEGPRDTQKHSKLPLFMRLHGGILPRMILPLVFVGCWATAVTLVHKYVSDIGVDTVLLVVLGFVVAFAVSFRSSTAYERYSEGRRYWSQLTFTSRNLGRLVWINMLERTDEEDSERKMKDLLGKITAINLIVAFSIALKHRLRFEPAIDYPDLQYLVAPITSTTIASHADQSKLKHKKPSTMKQVGEYLGLTFAHSNPRKLIKRSEDNLGNLPHEILAHLSAYFEKAMATKQIVGCHKFFWNDVRTMADILTGAERILNTPLPLAYTISIAQITWMYIMVLPFQLIRKLGFVTIPATMLAAYIILGLAMIGQEIENPFGNDVNDLPLESYCNEIADDLDVLISTPMNEYANYPEASSNIPLYPLSYQTTAEWTRQSEDDVRALLKAKARKAHARKMEAAEAEEV
ncbi:hypothetical protein LTR05_002307 [Lithohypha guttulata]|uniref:Bestrophin homolog n=1 Tax=Lithohypha guttulata TaxID=1690604 RepID=A0AAN7T248_9EURO|nr:hypothetical protein LTR05_002307 [Lithohypha guttulata]